MLTKKYYQMMADAISEATNKVQQTQAETKDKYTCVLAISVLTQELIKRFEFDNPAFDKAKFIKACGLEGWIK